MELNDENPLRGDAARHSEPGGPEQFVRSGDGDFVRPRHGGGRSFAVMFCKTASRLR